MEIALHANKSLHVLEVIAVNGVNHSLFVKIDSKYLLCWERCAGNVPCESTETGADNVVEIRFGQVLVAFIEHESVPIEMFQNGTLLGHALLASFSFLQLYISSKVIYLPY